MTEQPQEYIITEEQLKEISKLEQNGWSDLYHARVFGILVDVRSRPAPAEATENIQACLAPSIELCQYKGSSYHCISSKHDAAIRQQEREWWVLRVKAILQKTRFYDELDTALQELVQEATDGSSTTTAKKRDTS